MANASLPAPVKLFVGLLSNSVELLAEVRAALEQTLSPVDVESPVFAFDYTDYYEKEMGRKLKRRFLGFEQLVDPVKLVDVKLESARLEENFQRRSLGVPRPVNVDPGYLCASKVVLATFKDYVHRIYLGRGVYAEATLRYSEGEFADWPWTYPDYRSAGYKAFFRRMRDLYLLQLRHWRELERGGQ